MSEVNVVRLSIAAVCGDPPSGTLAPTVAGTHAPSSQRNPAPHRVVEQSRRHTPSTAFVSPHTARYDEESPITHIVGPLPPGHAALVVHDLEQTPQTQEPTVQSPSSRQLETQLVSLPPDGPSSLEQAWRRQKNATTRDAIVTVPRR
jgi:hypothetical protein